MTPAAVVAPERRPGPARLAAFTALLVAVSWGLGALAAWPWTASAPGTAVLRVSVRHVTAFSDPPAAARGAGAEVPRHMRPLDPSRPATGRRAEAVLTLVIDGRPALSRTLRPTGFRRDGPVHAYEEVPVPPGRRALTVSLREEGDEGRAWVLAREIELDAGQAPLLEYRAGSGWQ